MEFVIKSSTKIQDAGKTTTLYFSNGSGIIPVILRGITARELKVKQMFAYIQQRLASIVCALQKEYVGIPIMRIVLEIA